jgi:membrane-associated protease RseP (regulator of RpoE activity)
VQPRTTYNSGGAVRANAGAQPREQGETRQQIDSQALRGNQNNNRTFSRDAGSRDNRTIDNNRTIDGNRTTRDGQNLANRSNREANLGARFSENNNRLRVNDITANSAASQAGLRSGDEIVSVGGRNVRSQADFRNSLAGNGRNFNGRVPVVVRRNNALQTLYWTNLGLGLAGLGGYGSFGYGGYGYGPFGYGYGPYGYSGLGLGYYGSWYGPYRYGAGYRNGYYDSGYGYYDNSYDSGAGSGQFVGQNITQPDPNAAFLGVVLDTRHNTAAVVRDVYSYSPADTAGLQPGDTISRVNDQPISAPADLTGAVSQMQPGNSVTLTVTGPNPRNVEVTLSTRAEAQKALEQAAKQPQQSEVDQQGADARPTLPAPQDASPAPPAPAIPVEQ